MKEIPPCCENSILDNPRDREQFWKISRALGNPARLEIIRLLSRTSSCITGSIVHQLPLSQATVSQHLKALKEAGIIQGTIEGTAIRYCLNKDTIHWYSRMVQDAFGGSSAPGVTPQPNPQGAPR
ncbi:ArsR/SmtB family transcription factor [Spirochaeta lutea]|uniref:ArsR/SmtB family transcription factor n=1 Tax=Spirochaeta lutea TaxID=1480694 RepID=UPI0009DF4C2B|nr:metalloregulator ArsR/SmtB family transcription factor [Spirochaeta lutea]